MEMTAGALAGAIPGHALHLVQRSRGRGAWFCGEQDRAAYYAGLGRQAAASECAVHAYVLMGNHVHLLVTPQRADGLAELMRGLDAYYLRYLREARREARLPWDAPPEVRRVFPRRYLLGCMRYIEMNPVRAGLAAAPGDYRWSSYRANGLGIPDPLVQPHAFYCALGRTAAERQGSYRALFQRPVLRQRQPVYRAA